MSLKIVMADDEEDILQIMAKKIERSGYEVVTAKDGQEAWEKIQQVNPDVILLDLTMPKLDGFEVLKRVRQQPDSHKWQPVIIISARKELDDMQVGFKLEADHYIPKPCTVEDILKAVRLMSSLIPQYKTKGDKSEIDD